MAYPLISDQGAVTSWGTGGNQNAVILAGITPASTTIAIDGDSQNITGIGVSTETSIPGLKSARGTISGFMGSSPYIGAAANIAWGTGGYALHIQDFEAVLRTTRVHDLTEFNAGNQYKKFRPDSFAWGLRYTAIIDSGTAIVAPPDTSGSLYTVTLTYGSGATLAGTGLVRQVGVNITRGSKQQVVYEVMGNGNLTTASGIFGTSTLGSTFNTAPLWNTGGSATGAMVITAISGKTYTLNDSFWTSIRIRGTPTTPVSVSVDWQGEGTTIA
jgi:hypothetical protein